MWRSDHRSEATALGLPSNEAKKYAKETPITSSDELIERQRSGPIDSILSFKERKQISGEKRRPLHPEMCLYIYQTTIGSATIK